MKGRRVATYVHEEKFATGLGHDYRFPVEISNELSSAYCQQMKR